MASTLTDRAIDSIAAALELAAGHAPRLTRVALRVLGSTAVAAFAPVARAQEHGIELRRIAWGRALGDGLADLVCGPRALAWTGADGLFAVGGLVLAAHLAPWEAGAAALADAGLRPLVVAAPWPRLPRTAARVARWRARLGVDSVLRGREGWAAATRALAEGRAVVVLVDSAAPGRRGRSPRAFAGGPIADPAPLLAWAGRQNAPAWLAIGTGDGFELHPARDGAAVVDALDAAVRAKPWAWAWVRALAALAVAVRLAGCAPSPLPDPRTVALHVDDIRWEGTLPQGEAELRAARGTGRAGEAWTLHDAELRLRPTDHAILEITVQAARLQGRWPEGPAALTDVRWEALPADGRLDVEPELWRGATPTVRFDGERWRCDCPLDRLVAP